MTLKHLPYQSQSTGRLGILQITHCSLNTPKLCKHEFKHTIFVFSPLAFVSLRSRLRACSRLRAWLGFRSDLCPCSIQNCTYIFAKKITRREITCNRQDLHGPPSDAARLLPFPHAQLHRVASVPFGFLAPWPSRPRGPLRRWPQKIK